MIVGGMFGLPGESDLHGGCTPPFLAENSLLLANARSGIALLVERLAPAQVWVPSYLCAAVLQAINTPSGGARSKDLECSSLAAARPGPKASAKVCFYEVDCELAVRGLDWVEKVQPGDLVILIDYFGLPGDPTCAAGIRSRGAHLLEDASQALLSPAVGRHADFVLFSPRKFLGVPDGGILVSKCGVELDPAGLTPPSPTWWLRALTAAALRREFDAHGGGRRWFELFQEVEREQPVGGYAMSELARLLLTHAFDYPAIAAQRIENYRFLASQLGNIALFSNLPAEVVPLGFPIRVANRDQVRQALFAHEIYPPIHWPLAGVVPVEFKDSHRLSAEIMTLPCDQRYGRPEMETIAHIVATARAEENSTAKATAQVWFF